MKRSKQEILTELLGKALIDIRNSLLMFRNIKPGHSISDEQISRLRGLIHLSECIHEFGNCHKIEADWNENDEYFVNVLAKIYFERTTPEESKSYKHIAYHLREFINAMPAKMRCKLSYFGPEIDLTSVYPERKSEQAVQHGFPRLTP